ncbi:MAG: alpha-D-ribose 1-methylphosphonate 5-triphosphate diphosphatase [Pseudomonadota bacterium]|nr:alpha-D-ribose 1-methylphosphonate 5-triphosphate diphosphatase [Pseudomonadota bacterium]
MTETILSNCKLILADEIVIGSLVMKGDKIAGFDHGTTRGADDLEGDYLLPGFVELHTDHLEGHFHPRPGVAWPAVSAVIAHDAQITASGITTVFDALRAGTFDPGDVSAKEGETLARAITSAQDAGQLRAEHFIHIRCEMPCEDTAEAALGIASALKPKLISIMDHTPGARQFTSIDQFKKYYLGKRLISPEKIDAYIEERLEKQNLYAARNKLAILSLARELGIRIASHDDATEAHVAEALQDRVAIAEFPTTAESARAAHEAGLAVMMGAPNLVRGGSHNGNISAKDVAANGHLDILSSDYVPSSLLHAAFELPGRVPSLTLAQAIRTVTSNPAKAAGLNDRGEIAPGMRADLIQVHLSRGNPVVRRVWSRGRRVM